MSEAVAVQTGGTGNGGGGNVVPFTNGSVSAAGRIAVEGRQKQLQGRIIFTAQEQAGVIHADLRYQRPLHVSEAEEIADQLKALCMELRGVQAGSRH